MTIYEIANKQVSKKTLFWAFIIVVFFPSLIAVGLQQSSFIVGILSSSIFTIGIFLYLKAKKITITLHNSKTVFFFTFYCLLILALHTIIAILKNHNFDIFRFIGSIIAVFILLTAAYLFVLISEYSSPLTFQKAIGRILILFALIAIICGVFDINPANYRRLHRPIFPFFEPSHFALISAPFYLWAIAVQTSKKLRTLIAISPVVLLFFISNFTLVLLILLGVLIAFKLRNLFFFFIIIAIGFYFIAANLEYYSKRLDFSSSKSSISDLSTLVWLEGWEEAYIDFRQTNGIGVGFQQFGVTTPQGDAANAIYDILGNYSNRYDGGTFSAKIIGEFGCLGLVVILVILRKAWKSFLFLRDRVLVSNSTPQLIFYHCCVFYFVLELFVRSLSYLAPGFFIFALGIIGLTFNIYKNKRGLTTETDSQIIFN